MERKRDTEEPPFIDLPKQCINKNEAYQNEACIPELKGILKLEWISASLNKIISERELNNTWVRYINTKKIENT